VLYDSYINSGVGDLTRGIQFLEQFLTKVGGQARFQDSITRAEQHIRNDCQAINALNAVAAMNATSPPSGSPAPASAAPAANPNAPLPPICARYPPPANPNRGGSHRGGH
jgi:hypothetical protein